MTISGIDYGSYYSLHNVPVRNDMSVQKADDGLKTEEAGKKIVVSENSVVPEAEEDEEEEVRKAPAHSNPNDFTFDFKSGNRFNLIGAQSKVEDMDVDKAVSDMQKESVLNQYKFFVGTSDLNKVNLGSDEDGSVFIKK